MGGDASQLFDVARQLRVTNPIYATQTPGIDGISEPASGVEELAASYLCEIKNVQPQGPYLLIGYSFGGLVMMEIAQRLHKQGDVVGLLAMLDTYPHRTHLSFLQQFPLLGRLALRRVSSHARSLRTKQDQQQPESLVDQMRERIHSAESIAWRNYQPRFYPGRICFVKAKVPTYYPKNPRAVWDPLAAEFELHTVPGDHIALVTSQSKLVADLLSGLLTQNNISVVRGPSDNERG
jgi:thioesterase domain-containing protein